MLLHFLAVQNNDWHRRYHRIFGGAGFAELMPAVLPLTSQPAFLLDQVLFTLAERKSREFLIVPIADKTSTCVMAAMKQIQEIYSEHFSEVFKTITTDNGSEFADLAELEKMADTLVYYAHPYTSCDKGTVERHNGLIRRFIPKGKRIDAFTSQQIDDVEIWCNCLPRKILGYRTPDEIFEEELDQIYQITA